jgi:hypothetical protein
MERSEGHKVGALSFSAKSFSSTPRESQQGTVFPFGAFIKIFEKMTYRQASSNTKKITAKVK